MAVIGKIRDKMGWLLIVVIGLAMLAFILGDLMGKGNQGGQSNGGNIVGSINGVEVSIADFEENVQRESNNYTQQSGQAPNEDITERIREQVWAQTVNRISLEEQIQKAGIQVCSEELWDIEQGADPHPYIKQGFTNPETGQFDRKAFVSERKKMEEEGQEERQAYWLKIEGEILKERLQEKYINLINKGLYVTKFQAEQEAKEQSKVVDLKYVIKRYASIPDTEVKFTDADIDKIYNETKEKYKQEASRAFDYVVFDVTPTSADTAEIVNWFNDLKPEFVKTDDVKWFVNGQSDKKFNDAFISTAGLSDKLAGLANLSVGTVTDLFLEGNSYKMARLAGVSLRADSVKARHILIKSKGAVEANNKFADSLKNAVKAGSDFAALAVKFSEDQGSGKQGGDLGWFAEGQMVKPFSDACFDGEVGDLLTVESQFGTHLIQIQQVGPKSRKVKIGVIERAIEPSENTYNNTFAKANKFASVARSAESFDKAIVDQNLAKRIAENVKEVQGNINGIPGARNLIKWVYTSNIGDVSTIQEFNNRFVIAKVTKIVEKGFASKEDRKLELEAEAIKAKKAEVLIAKINKAKSSNIDGLAAALGETVGQSDSVTFAGYTINGLGREFKVQGAAFALTPNKISQPIEGEQGVYVIQVVATRDNPADLATSKAMLTQAFANRGTYGSINAIKEAAEIEDKRGSIY